MIEAAWHFPHCTVDQDAGMIMVCLPHAAHDQPALWY
jgi:hypothetical protein